MTVPPICKAMLAISIPILLFGGNAKANSHLPEDFHLLNDDRYRQSEMTAADFIDPIVPTPAPSYRNRSVDVPASTFTLSPSLRAGLSHAARYLQRQNPNHTVARQGLNIPNRTLSQTLNQLLNWHGQLQPEALQQQFDLVPLTNKQSQHSKFTGYYTPIIKASAKPDARFRYPVYRSPMSAQLRHLSRSQINNGALKNKGLEVAWTNDPIGLFYMQVQGSGILEYPNGHKVSLQFDGSNKKRFSSLSKYMTQQGLLRGNPGRERIQKWLYANPQHLQHALNSNPRYVYFKPATSGVRTASGMPIIPVTPLPWILTTFRSVR